jgi:hypothetical protein
MKRTIMLIIGWLAASGAFVYGLLLLAGTIQLKGHFE